MRRITFSIWLVWLLIFDINAELTLESVNQKVNALEVEVTALKVYMTNIHDHIHDHFFDSKALKMFQNDDSIDEKV